MGAAQVFDYHSATVVADVIAVFAGRTLAGAIALGDTGAASCIRIASKCEGTKFVSIASPPVSFHSLAEGNRGRFERPGVILRLISSNLGLQVGARTRGVNRVLPQVSVKHGSLRHGGAHAVAAQAVGGGLNQVVPVPSSGPVVAHGSATVLEVIEVPRTPFCLS
ncbi:MAG: hypothetical protein ABI873_05655, partial [Marmoricola sp.]